MMILNHPRWVRIHKFQIHRKPSSVSGEVVPPNPHRPPRSGSCVVVSMKRLKSSLRRRISVKSSKGTRKRQQRDRQLHGLSSTSKFVKARIAGCCCRYFFYCRYIFCMAHEEVVRRYEEFLFYFG
ncbi:uncharacterized protein LOC132274473 [Cornus florida]|uniref:uncharacterized protein LOC132274473 n=1 Tax=Cornus florida TaxID=4283 RepID=UPI00289EBB26|nr:uncharacterized protein LOC132274473 [Cornus florida]